MVRRVLKAEIELELPLSVSDADVKELMDEVYNSITQNKRYGLNKLSWEVVGMKEYEE